MLHAAFLPKQISLLPASLQAGGVQRVASWPALKPDLQWMFGSVTTQGRDLLQQEAEMAL